MMDFNRIVTYLQKRGEATLAELQLEFAVPFSELRQAIQVLIDQKLIKRGEGMLFLPVREKEEERREEERAGAAPKENPLEGCVKSIRDAFDIGGFAAWMERDPLYARVVEFCYTEIGRDKPVTTSALQVRFRLGFASAALVRDTLKRFSVLSEDGCLLLTEQEYEILFGKPPKPSSKMTQEEKLKKAKEEYKKLLGETEEEEKEDEAPKREPFDLARFLRESSTRKETTNPVVPKKRKKP